MHVSGAVVEHLDAPFRIEQLELDEPGPGEALVRVVAAGVCHTDHHGPRSSEPSAAAAAAKR